MTQRDHDDDGDDCVDDGDGDDDVDVGDGDFDGNDDGDVSCIVDDKNGPKNIEGSANDTKESWQTTIRIGSDHEESQLLTNCCEIKC